MAEGNLSNLVPFEKGHKKIGGRKRGTPNKLTRDLKEAIVAAAEIVGLDGKGFGGVTGYMVGLALKHPKSYATLLGRLMPIQPPPPVRETHNLKALNDDELMILEQLLARIQPLPPDPEAEDDASKQEIDVRQYHKRIAELWEDPSNEEKES